MTYLLALSSFLSRLLGIVRHNRFADVFGTSGLSDAYFAAFQIPDLIYSIIIYGALSAAFVPLFVGYLKDKKKEEMWEFTNAVLTMLLSFVIVLIVFIYFFAPWLVSLLYAGFDAETQGITVNLMRIMLLSPLFFAFSSVFASVQTSFRNFIFYALAPLLYNASIIYGIVYLSPTYGISGVAYGVILGAFLHAAIQFPVVWSLGFRVRVFFAWKRSDIVKLIRLSIPRVLGILLLHVNLLVEGFIASLGVVGSLSVLRYAQDLQSFPMGIIGLSVAISSFSTLSSLALSDDGRKSFVSHLSKQIGNILFLILPAAVGIYLLRDPIVSLILQSGAFSAESASLTAMTLGVLSVGLFAVSLTPLFQRAFYALEDTKTPLMLGIFMVALNTILSFTLAPRIGVIGIALANVIAVSAHIVLLFIFLQRRVGTSQRLYSLGSLGRILLTTIFMTVALIGIMQVYSIPVDMLGLFMYLSALVVSGIFVYLLIAYFMKAPELYENVLFRKFTSKKSLTS